MKKFLIGLLIIVVVVGVLLFDACVMAKAEGYDDIFNLENFLRVKEEYDAGNVIILFPSSECGYFVGKHIEPGNYLMTAVEGFGDEYSWIRTEDGSINENLGVGCSPIYGELVDGMNFEISFLPVAFLKLD